MAGEENKPPVAETGMRACPAFAEAASRRQAKRRFGVRAWVNRSSMLRMEVKVPSPSLQEIKQRVEALERELSLLRSIPEILQDSFLFLDQKGTFLKVNPRGEVMLGYPWEELRQMVFLDVVDLEDLSRVRDGFEAMKENPEVRFKTRIVNRLGREGPGRGDGLLPGGDVSHPPEGLERSRQI